MKKQHKIFIVLALYFFILSCDRSGMLKVEMNSCPKQLEPESAETNDTGITTIKLLHKGFCYDFIDSMYLTKKYLTGTQKVFISDTALLSKRYFHLDNKTDDNCQINIKTSELSDTAQTIKTEITAIYQNHTLSNTVEVSYQTACKKEITNPTYKLLDTSACETSAGIGDRYMVSFLHKGYCTTEIDSIGGSGDFYSFDGYFWNSSDFIIPSERIIFHENNTYLQQLDFKLCVTFHESDFVHNKIWMVYKDKTKSNKAVFEIIFKHHKKNQAIQNIREGEM